MERTSADTEDEREQIKDNVRAQIHSGPGYGSKGCCF